MTTSADTEYEVPTLYCVDERISEIGVAELSALQFSVLMLLPGQMDQDNRVYAHPTALAMQLNVQPPPVRAALKALVERGLLIATDADRTYVVNPRYFFWHEDLQEALEARYPGTVACAPSSVRRRGHLTLVD